MTWKTVEGSRLHRFLSYCLLCLYRWTEVPHSQRGISYRWDGAAAGLLLLLLSAVKFSSSLRPLMVLVLEDHHALRTDDRKRTITTCSPHFTFRMSHSPAAAAHEHLSVSPKRAHDRGSSVG
ncbi:hypothetical protein BofuT4_P148210.1 [Botrytis cinerea T4]|uniref:Uncharacterized protein n=1 Tax=Botryotinia fuckeliana (strain T4) TaxID=999810 RepID=G2YWX3_BOTF4|nr:hypothetical protein BofuT4_P148210.1 [Botrytis cinerea T4]